MGRATESPAPTPPPGRRRLLTAALVLGSLVAGLVPGAGAAASAGRSDIAAFDAVDPFIGTRLDTSQNKGNSAYGNTYPGATVPFGMVQSSPTTYRSSDKDQKGGYEYTADKIRGFGMTRLSGTGCEGRFSGFDFPVLPYTGELPGGALPTAPADRITDYYLGFDHADEKAEPGYYSVGLANGVDAELTATTRTAVSRFDFPADGGSTLILDVAGSNNRVFGSEVTVDGNTVTGWVEAASVCDEGGRYRAYFSATFDRPVRSHGTWQGSEVRPGADTASGGTTQHGAGAYLVFDRGARVTARTGLSYVSVEGAARNAATETRGKSFDAVRAQSARVWRDALNTLRVDGGTRDQRVKFSTALYHALLRDINQSLTDMAAQSGAWPNWPHLNQLQQKMSGDSLQSVVASLDAFGSTDYDRRAALESMRSTQTLPADATLRRHAYQYATVGFVESRKGDSATSKTLEYAVDDFGIAQLAKRLGDEETYDRFMVRAQSWQNLFDDVSGRIRPRDRTGFDRNFNLGERGNQFEQATGYQYGWMVPHNVGALIEKRGGVEAALQDLDEHTRELDAGVYNTKGAYLSNQPSFTMPFVYHWLGRPDRTGEVLRRAADEMYGTTPSGLPGNDDLGSLSSWYVWANIGLFPAVPGTADLVVSSPVFERVVVDSADSRRRITLDAPGADRAPYVAALKVDGRATSKSWVPAEFTREGGRLDLRMASRPGAWGTGARDVPPSYADGSDARNNVGVTPDGHGNLGSLDLSDNSLSRERLSEAGAAPGAKLPLGDTGVVFTWPDTAPGEPDNWIPHGQRIPLGGRQATGISFLGLATNGPSQGTAVVEYTNGSTQAVPVGLSDWTPGTTYQFGNEPLVVTTGRNRAAGGSDTAQTKVFGTRPVALDPGKRVAAVVLPRGTDRGVMHVFDVALTDRPVAAQGQDG